MRISAFIALELLLILPITSLADLRIVHIDVDQGDATLIVDTKTKNSLLIDAGNQGYGRKRVVPLLKNLGVSKVTYFLATHYDSDHIGGFDEVVANGIIVEKAVLDRGDFTDRKVKTATGRNTQYGEYVQAAGQERETVRLCEQDAAVGEPDSPQRQFISVGEDTEIEIVAACGKYIQLDGDSGGVGTLEISKQHDNDLSIALVVRHGEFDYFIGGDLTGGGRRTSNMEQSVAPWVGNVDVLRLNHHGSATSTSEEFLDTLTPEVAIISVGDGGVNLRYRLPRQVVLNRLAKLRPKPMVFQTHRGEDGRYKGAYIEKRDIVIYTDGRSYTVNGVSLPVDERARKQKHRRDDQ